MPGRASGRPRACPRSGGSTCNPAPATSSPCSRPAPGSPTPSRSSSRVAGSSGSRASARGWRPRDRPRRRHPCPRRGRDRLRSGARLRGDRCRAVPAVAAGRRRGVQVEARLPSDPRRRADDRIRHSDPASGIRSSAAARRGRWCPYAWERGFASSARTGPSRKRDEPERRADARTQVREVCRIATEQQEPRNVEPTVDASGSSRRSGGRRRALGASGRRNSGPSWRRSRPSVSGIPSMRRASNCQTNPRPARSLRATTAAQGNIIPVTRMFGCRSARNRGPSAPSTTKPSIPAGASTVADVREPAGDSCERAADGRDLVGLPLGLDQSAAACRRMICSEKQSGANWPAAVTNPCVATLRRIRVAERTPRRERRRARGVAASPRRAARSVGA